MVQLTRIWLLREKKLESLPLQLKNRVTLSKLERAKAPCTEQMMSIMTCLEKFDQNQSMCKDEITAYEGCMKKARAEKDALKTLSETEKKKDMNKIPVGPNAKMSSHQMTDFIRKFPGSRRKGQAFQPPSNYPRN